MWKFIVYSLRIRRVEYRIAELPLFLIPVLLTVRHESAFLSAEFWEGLTIFLFFFTFGDLLNCLADRDLDAIDKPRFTEAVYGIGVRGVILQAVFSALCAMALAIHLAWLRDRWLLIPATAFALFTAYAYSVPPIRLKGRGLWQLAFYGLGLFVGPMLFAAMLFRDLPGWNVMAVALSYGLLQTGILLVNTAEDYPEDRQMGVRTVIVALGLRRGITVAFLLASIGTIALIADFSAIVRIFASAGRSIALIPLFLSSAIILLAISRLHKRVAGADEAVAVTAVKRAAQWVPLGITAIAVSSLIAAVAAFLCTYSREIRLNEP